MEAIVLLMIVFTVLGIIFLVVWFSIRNKLVQLSGQVNQSIGTLASQYQQRHDLIPDVLQSARAAVKAQRDYLDKMLEVRKGMHPGLSPVDLGTMPPDLAPLMAGTMAAAAGKAAIESNPAMCVEAFTELQRILKDTEKDVSAARRFYWAAVAEYNVAVRSVPTAIVASVHGFLPLPDPTISAKLAVKPDYGISV
ncbi:MAG: LemA family protein [Planctomycetes bacterium]|nr:LemA family protein [Planctomycetota bacterium]